MVLEDWQLILLIILIVFMAVISFWIGRTTKKDKTASVLKIKTE